MLLQECGDDDNDEINEPDGGRPSLGLRGGPCGNVTAADDSGNTSEDDKNPLSTSLEPKYFSQSFSQEQEDSDDGWNHCPDNMELEFQQGRLSFLKCFDQKFTELILRTQHTPMPGVLWLTVLLVFLGVSATHSVVYQNEEGQWVTDLAYYSPFEKEVDEKTSENTGQFQTEDFVPASM